MLRLQAERALQSKLVYRGYDLEVRRAPSGWQVGIYPRSADLPIIGRNEIFAPAIQPGASDLIDKTAYDSMRAFRGPFVEIHAITFRLP